ETVRRDTEPVWSAGAYETRPGTMAGMQSLAQIELGAEERLSSGIKDLDLVLGGGIVAGSLVLIAGEPGVGKSTLLLEICRAIKGDVLYFSGEESVRQIALRSRRMEIERPDVFVVRETDPAKISTLVQQQKPALVLIDSIQTLYRPDSQQIPGMPGQLKESTMLLMDTAKRSQVPIVISGHITKEGNVAGPRMLEHMVDTVLLFESDRLNHLRLLRANKNRFGSVGEVALFEMHTGGLRTTAFAALQADQMHGSPAPGRLASVLQEGSRSICLEVQALVSRNPYGPIRRMAEGLDSKRVNLLAAVLEKYLKLRLADCDIFANLAGGLSGRDPALDLALCAAIASSCEERLIDGRSACIGEVGLSGEVRPVHRLMERLQELERLGYQRVYGPPDMLDPKFQRSRPQQMELVVLQHISELGRLWPAGAAG
ncbi:MAG: DNA repair protein RadA, partial [Leptospiraceae bacterium]|nr:DNA repair protein RadA [Leptospiraceae bacterium]